MAAFFAWLYRQQSPTITEEYASDDVEEVIRKIKEESKQRDKHPRGKKAAEKIKPKAAIPKKKP